MMMQQPMSGRRPPVGAASLMALDNSLAGMAQDPNDLESLAAFGAGMPGDGVMPPAEPEEAAAMEETEKGRKSKWDDPRNPYFRLAQQFEKYAMVQAMEEADADLRARGVHQPGLRQMVLGSALQQWAGERSAKAAVIAKVTEEMREAGIEVDRKTLEALTTPAQMNAVLQALRSQARASDYATRQEGRVDAMDGAQGGGFGGNGARLGDVLAQGLRDMDRRARGRF